MDWLLETMENWAGNVAGIGEKGTACQTLVGRVKERDALKYAGVYLTEIEWKAIK